MSALKKVLYAIDRVVFKIAYGIEFLTTAVLVIAVMLQVFTRYVLRSPLRWTTELCCFMLIYSVFIGGAIALRQGEHVYLDISKIKMPGFLRTTFHVISHLAVYFFIIVTFYYGLQLSISNMGSLSEAMKFPYGYIYMILPISAAMMFLEYTVNLLKKTDQEVAEE